TKVTTSLQLSNPSDAAITGRLRFLPASGGAAGTIGFSLPARATRTVADLSAAVGLSGPGTLDVVNLGGSLPIALARVVTGAGTSAMQLALEPARGPMGVLHAGDRVSVAAPADGAGTLRIGVRATGGKDLLLSYTAYDAQGHFLAQGHTTITAGTNQETDLAAFTGRPAVAGEILEISVDAGAGTIYGSTLSGDAASYQPANRLASF